MFSPRSWMRQHIPTAVRTRLRWGRHTEDAPNFGPIHGIATYLPSDPGETRVAAKHALLSFITTPFRLSPDDPRNLQFCLIGVARNLVRVLNEFGYVVDVIEWSDMTFVPAEPYEIFIGHGGRNFEQLASHLPPDALRVYFSTGLYWKEHNRREEERFKWLEERRGVRLPYDRWIDYSEESALRAADGIICLGNQFTKESYADFPLVIDVNNAVYQDDRYDKTDKDFAAGRARFLFFAGSGNIHKGLDLLLEAFSGIELELYICQGIRPDFREVYRAQLEGSPNIHLVGTVALRSPQFYQVMDRCNFTIHLSCSEGQSGSVLECMNQGLIPVISRETNIDTADFGITLEEYSIDHIVRTVVELSQRPVEWHKAMSQRARAAAQKEFSEQAFLTNMRGALQRVLASRAGHV
jgi:glycosyltransferase involved in cell wall biosynthesis